MMKTPPMCKVCLVIFGTNSTAPGTTSTLRASGPWLWSCTGSNGGSNAQCSAHLLSNTGGNGTCGSANGTSDNNAPTTGLCSSGTASALSGNGAPWTWSCGSSQCWATLPAYYVSTSGNDFNNGTSPSTPFASLGKAQSALQGSGTKIAYIRAGTYRPPSVGSGGACESGASSSVNLGSNDSGETWSFYPPDGYGSAIIDGGSTQGGSGGSGGTNGCTFADNNASNVTFIGLQFQHYQFSALWTNGASNITFTDISFTISPPRSSTEQLFRSTLRQVPPCRTTISITSPILASGHGLGVRRQ